MQFEQWIAALEKRHLADLRIPEVTRALRALSSAYVERRHTVARGGPLESAGKRAAFALFYAPLHFLATTHVVQAVGGHEPPPSAILISAAAPAPPAQQGTVGGGSALGQRERSHAWALDEARWTYRAGAERETARQGDAGRLPIMRPEARQSRRTVLTSSEPMSSRASRNQLFSAAGAASGSDTGADSHEVSRPGGATPRAAAEGAGRAGRRMGDSRSICRRCCKRWTRRQGSTIAS